MYKRQKYSLPNAEQKNYIQSNVITITKIVTTVVQIIVIPVSYTHLDVYKRQG